VIGGPKSAAVPHPDGTLRRLYCVESPESWFEDFGNRAEGFVRLNGRIDEACEQAGRDPGEVRRSVCLLVQVEGGAGERPARPEAPPLHAATLAAELAALESAGADEAILVLDPITEPAIRSLRTALPSG